MIRKISTLFIFMFLATPFFITDLPVKICDSDEVECGGDGGEE